MDLLDGVVLGLHLASIHYPAYHGQNDINPGIYAHLDNGVVVGTYHNTLKKQTVYLGWSSTEWYHASVMIGIASGYQRRQYDVTCSQEQQKYYTHCSMRTSGIKAYLTPMVAPSISLPEVVGITPRVTFLPGFAGSSNVLHLSIERKF